MLFNRIIPAVCIYCFLNFSLNLYFYLCHLLQSVFLFDMIDVDTLNQTKAKKMNIEHKMHRETNSIKRHIIFTYQK